MNSTILVAGGTGNLGGRIVKALIARGANVHVLVRESSDGTKKAGLEKMGATLIHGDLNNLQDMTEACKGVSCVVSALAGLHDVIVGAQTVLLNAAVAAGVPRFIPSDYSSDFTTLPKGDNRNFDLRREFHLRLENANISATSIFNGAFDYILRYNTPLYDVKKNVVSYWGDSADWQLDFSTLDNVADFTAAAALDATTPRFLRIASFKVSPNDLVAMGTRHKKTAFKLVHMGSLTDFAAYIKRERAQHPEGETELYPRWQSSQYMHSMFATQSHSLNNDRYPDVKWATAQQVITTI